LTHGLDAPVVENDSDAANDDADNNVIDHTQKQTHRGPLPYDL